MLNRLIEVGNLKCLLSCLCAIDCTKGKICKRLIFMSVIGVCNRHLDVGGIKRFFALEDLIFDGSVYNLDVLNTDNLDVISCFNCCFNVCSNEFVRYLKLLYTYDRGIDVCYLKLVVGYEEFLSVSIIEECFKIACVKDSVNKYGLINRASANLKRINTYNFYFTVESKAVIRNGKLVFARLGGVYIACIYRKVLSGNLNEVAVCILNEEYNVRCVQGLTHEKLIYQSSALDVYFSHVKNGNCHRVCE